MNLLLATGLILSFTIINDTNFYGTYNNQSFSETVISEEPYIKKFEMGEEKWFICEGGVMNDLKDLSICVSK